jgi:hypothetical protein
VDSYGKVVRGKVRAVAPGGRAALAACRAGGPCRGHSRRARGRRAAAVLAVLLGLGCLAVSGGGTQPASAASRAGGAQARLTSSQLAVAAGRDDGPAGTAAALAHQARAVACSDVYFLGARGSGEPATPGFHGLGPEVYKMATVVKDTLNADHITLFRTLNIAYAADSVSDLAPTSAELAGFKDPATAAAEAVYYYQNNVEKYLGSISEGISSTVSEAEYVHSQCPQALLILAGYSQGAMVMHQAELQLAADGETGVLSQIAGTLLLGDGDRVSHTEAREFGSSSARSEGVRTYLGFNSDQDVVDPATTANICNAGDIVCDFGINTLIHWKKGIKVHTSYAVPNKNGTYVFTQPAAWVAQLAANRLISTQWTATEAPLPAGAASNPDVSFQSLACPSTTSCVAVGGYDDSSNVTHGLLETGAGAAWAATEAPLPPQTPAEQSGLYSVACPSATTCVAVGQYYSPTAGADQGLLVTGSGTSWAAAKAPLPSNAGDSFYGTGLQSVACASTSVCVAVGGYFDSSGDAQGMLVTGSGTSWSATEAPLPPNAATYPDVAFQSVACPSTTVCVAVGWYYDSSNVTHGLLETGSGTTWTATEEPLPPNAAAIPSTILQSVSCPSTTSCVATGQYADSSGATRGLLVTGSGTTWTATEEPLPATGASPSGIPPSVACPSTTSCVVAGEYLLPPSYSEGMLVTGSGTTWTATEAPPLNASSDAGLQSVACPSTTSCVASGFDATDGLLVTGSGTTWTATEAPLPPDASSSLGLQSVACPSTISCVATGSYIDSSGNQDGLLVTGGPG